MSKTKERMTRNTKVYKKIRRKLKIAHHVLSKSLNVESDATLRC